MTFVGSQFMKSSAAYLAQVRDHIFAEFRHAKTIGELNQAHARLLQHYGRGAAYTELEIAYETLREELRQSLRDSNTRPKGNL